MQQEIRQHEDMLLPPAGGFAAALPPVAQHSQQHVPQQLAADGSAPRAAVSHDNGSSPVQPQQQQAASDPNCLDGTTETRESDSGNLADWMLSVASKPRRGDSSAASPDTGLQGGGGAASAAVSQPLPRALAASWQPSSGGGGAEGFGSSSFGGGRGGVVSTLAVAEPAAAAVSTSVATALRPDAELALAPAPEDCEPDWLLSASGVSGLGELQLRSPSQRHQGQRASGDEAAAAQQVAAMRRHNNRMLAEAGVLNNVMSWTVTAGGTGVEREAEPDIVLAPQQQPQQQPSQPAAAVQQSSASPTGRAAEQRTFSGKKFADGEQYDYII